MSVPNPPPSRTQSAVSRLSDLVFRIACQASGLLMIAVVLGLVALLTYQSWPVLTRAGHFQLFTSSNWDPNGTTTSDKTPVFGSLVFVYGTLATSAIAMLIAVPLGVGTAAFLSEIAPAWVRRTCSFSPELWPRSPASSLGFWGCSSSHLRRLGLSQARHRGPASGQGILGRVDPGRDDSAVHHGD